MLVGHCDQKKREIIGNPRAYQPMKIGSVSRQTGLGIHTIRYYEKQGLIRRPLKDSSGHRYYDASDVEILGWIACMKHSGMSLTKIKKYAKGFYDKDSAICIALLQEHLGHLFLQHQSIDHYIAVTQDKISRFKSA